MKNVAKIAKMYIESEENNQNLQDAALEDKNETEK